jgi:branched-chain amino acid aminotransferase
MTTPKAIWLDGALVAESDARVPILTHTLHYGLGLFEGIRAYERADGQTAIFRLREHLERMFEGAHLAMMKPRVSFDALFSACTLVVKESGLGNMYLRPLMFVGDGAMGIYAPDNPVRTLVTAWDWGTYLGNDAIENGIRTKISPWSRHHPSATMSKAKIVGHYVNSIMAKRDAKASGLDEAILLDTSGLVCEGSGENIFIVKKDAIITPPLSQSILAGITRDTICTLAREEGFVVHEEPFTRERLYAADEAFFTGTAAEVTPIREVDFRMIGAGKRGPMTTRLQARYFDVVRGSDDTHPEWLTSVA